MPFDDFLADGQANAAARILGARVQTFEDDKNGIGMFGSNANAVIHNRKDDLLLCFIGRDANEGRLGAVKFDGVSDQILEQLRQSERNPLSPAGDNRIRRARRCPE